MVPPALSTPALLLGAAMDESNGLESPLVSVGAAVFALLTWLLWRSKRRHAGELADLARRNAKEHEQAGLEKENLLRESQAKSEMLATLSREIRAHLNGIIGSADLMLDHTLKPRQREHLTTLRASAESLHQSLNDVLDYSRIETGQLQIGRASFDLRQPLIEVVETLSPLAHLKNLELVLFVAPDVPLLVAGDAARLRQVFLNLTANAVKFTASGRVVLRVEFPAGSPAEAPPGTTWLHFSVTDTSAGIPAEVQATIFDRSHESSSPSPRKFGGSGLELAMSKRLVELMGGRIGARSLPEGGSEFWVDLALPADRIQPPLALGSPLHVVLLDPLAASRVAASAMLTRLNVDQDATDTMAKALLLLRDALDEEAVELVLLLDESVAKESREGIAQLLAPDSPLRDTRLVLMSRNPEEAAAALPDFPAAAIVRKPLLRPELLGEALRAKPAKGVLKAIDSRAPFEAAADIPPTPRQGPLVLVVDDDSISRSVSSQLLALLGCSVKVVTSGADAIAITQTTRFDLIFMDLQMPTLDGYMTTEKIRDNSGGKTPPIVALTANTSDADRDKCFAVGMCDFISKPVHKNDLARILKQWAPVAAAK